MHLAEAISLIKHTAIINTKPVQWADLGCGSGLFTRALSTLLQRGSTIYAVDKDMRNFNGLEDKHNIQPIQSDFVQDALPLQNLDGVLMANSLHYVKDKPAFLHKLAAMTKQDACLLVVEYDTGNANPWVPYPISFQGLHHLFAGAGYKVEKINEQPSLYGRAMMYGAIIFR